MEPNNPPCEANSYCQSLVQLLCDSYQRLLHRPLIEVQDPRNLGRGVFVADFALLAHSADADPLFNYANQTALQLFEFGWQELIGLPSRQSAEAGNQQAREQALAKVAEQGYIEHYNAVRISKTGRRFRIEDVVIWNVYADDGVYHGQAACFTKWSYL
jgi:hypothetical protein